MQYQAAWPRMTRDRTWPLWIPVKQDQPTSLREFLHFCASSCRST
jgi:hypothetical protein